MLIALTVVIMYLHVPRSHQLALTIQHLQMAFIYPTNKNAEGQLFSTNRVQHEVSSTQSHVDKQQNIFGQTALTKTMDQ